LAYKDGEISLAKTLKTTDNFAHSNLESDRASSEIVQEPAELIPIEELRIWDSSAAPPGRSMYPYVILGLVILLPIIPASLLFTALPNNTANVGGKLQGLEIKLGGAFAGYFAILLLIVANHAILVPPPPVPPPPYQVWEVSGRILNESGQPVEPLELRDVSLAPSYFNTDRSGYFSLKFYSWPDLNGGYAYPRLIISHDNYQPVPIPLNPSDPMLHDNSGPLRVTVSNQHIDLHDISLKQISVPYPVNLKPLNTASSVLHSRGGVHATN
jgi:hypothetical protein